MTTKPTARQPTGQISTHTLTWSVTYNIALIGVPSDISTHTLTWSVTVRFAVAYAIQSYFNSHAHVERDGIAGRRLAGLCNFNSHAHVERDCF